MGKSRRIVFVWAPWCRTCRTMGPIVDAVAETYRLQVASERVNADEEAARVRALGVWAVPTLIALEDDQEIARLTGAQPASGVTGLFARAAGEQEGVAPGMTATDRRVRVVAGVLVLSAGLLSGPSVPLLVAGAVLAATAVPRPAWLQSPQ